MRIMRNNQSANPTSDWESFFSGQIRAFEPLFRPALKSSSRPSVNRQVEWYENEENYFCLVELPGVRRENLSVDLEEGILKLSYLTEKSFPGTETPQEDHFEFVLRTPEGVEIHKTSARLEDGILQLTFPKSEEKKPLRIEVS